MINPLRDIFTCIHTYFIEQLGNLKIESNQEISFNVKLAFKDDRTETIRTYPEATLSLIDYKRGSSRKYGGFDRTIENNPDDASGNTKLIKKVPIPVDLYFQLDIYTDKFDHDWVGCSKLMQLFDTEFALTTPDQNSVRIKVSAFENLDRMDDGKIFRKTFRFLAETWLDHHEAPTLSYLVKKLKFDMNNNNYNVQINS